ncbi:MAG: cupin domain-containing protein [Bacillota bacterium]
MKVVQRDEMRAFGDIPQRRPLVETDEMRLLSLCLRAGQALPPHAAPCDLTLQCLEGRGTFLAEDQTIEMTPGVLVHLPRHVQHSLVAQEDLVCLQVLTPNPRRPHSPS